MNSDEMNASPAGFSETGGGIDLRGVAMAVRGLSAGLLALTFLKTRARKRMAD
ncbi:hypothetical protein RZS28_12325 [Methylocapsa polymorpha]|uniref:Uncharacterized protein n=1 Tax=Methylocapsa polymorpha TaxID=3080828 RepID=A0ABZ0HMR9_9HYPH|nr:hypothetical protein RZS28_12325 [Methylocapsa sp. RX1]